MNLITNKFGIKKGQKYICNLTCGQGVCDDCTLHLELNFHLVTKPIFMQVNIIIFNFSLYDHILYVYDVDANNGQLSEVKKGSNIFFGMFVKRIRDIFSSISRNLIHQLKEWELKLQMNYSTSGGKINSAWDRCKLWDKWRHTQLSRNSSTKMPSIEDILCVFRCNNFILLSFLPIIALHAVIERVCAFSRLLCKYTTWELLRAEKEFCSGWWWWWMFI